MGHCTCGYVFLFVSRKRTPLAEWRGARVRGGAAPFVDSTQFTTPNVANLHTHGAPCASHTYERAFRLARTAGGQCAYPWNVSTCSGMRVCCSRRNAADLKRTRRCSKARYCTPVGSVLVVQKVAEPATLIWRNAPAAGLHISGDPGQDNVAIAITPQEDHEFCLKIDKHHAGGTFWCAPRCASKPHPHDPSPWTPSASRGSGTVAAISRRPSSSHRPG